MSSLNSLRIFFVFGPFYGVVSDMLADDVKVILTANDVLVVVPLPHRGAG